MTVEIVDDLAGALEAIGAPKGTTLEVDLVTAAVLVLSGAAVRSGAD